MNLTRPHEECGIFGVYNHKEASNLTYLGLYALQHRGQESCGIVSSDGTVLHAHKRMGLVADVFGNQEIFKKLLIESHVSPLFGGWGDMRVAIQPTCSPTSKLRRIELSPAHARHNLARRLI